MLVSVPLVVLVSLSPPHIETTGTVDWRIASISGPSFPKFIRRFSLGSLSLSDLENAGR